MEDEQLEATDKLAASAIGLYDLSPAATAERINVSENTTYRVSDPATGRRYALRVHRLGYQSPEAIASELAWVDALRTAGVVETAGTVAARDGSRVSLFAQTGQPSSSTSSSSSGWTALSPMRRTFHHFVAWGRSARACMGMPVDGVGPRVSRVFLGTAISSSARRVAPAAGRTVSAWGKRSSRF